MFFFFTLDSVSSLDLCGAVSGHILLTDSWRASQQAGVGRLGSIFHTASKSTCTAAVMIHLSPEGVIWSVRKSEEQSARPRRPFILPNHRLRGERFKISACMTARSCPLVALHQMLRNRSITASIWDRGDAFQRERAYVLPRALWPAVWCFAHKQAVICGEDVKPIIYLSSDTDVEVPPGEEVGMINNWISPGCDFIHYLSSNWCS